MNSFVPCVKSYFTVHFQGIESNIHSLLPFLDFLSDMGFFGMIICLTKMLRCRPQTCLFLMEYCLMVFRCDDKVAKGEGGFGCPSFHSENMHPHFIHICGINFNLITLYCIKTNVCGT